MTTVELIQAIQEAYPDVTVSVWVAHEFCNISVLRLPQDKFPKVDSGEAYPNGLRIGWNGDHAQLTVNRYADKDIDEALRTALAVVTNPSEVSA